MARGARLRLGYFPSPRSALAVNRSAHRARRGASARRGTSRRGDGEDAAERWSWPATPAWARPRCSKRPGGWRPTCGYSRRPGVESELELPFASLHELLRPVLGRLERLPPPQARALASALALEQGEPDTLAVGAGVLSLLVEAAEETPALVVLDDAHWLDRASAEALAFAARRLSASSWPSWSRPGRVCRRCSRRSPASSSSRWAWTTRGSSCAGAAPRWRPPTRQRLLARRGRKPARPARAPRRARPGPCRPRRRRTSGWRARSRAAWPSSRPARVPVCCWRPPSRTRPLSVGSPNGSRSSWPTRSPRRRLPASSGSRANRSSSGIPSCARSCYSSATAAERRAVHQALAEALSGDADLRPTSLAPRCRGRGCRRGGRGDPRGDRRARRGARRARGRRPGAGAGGPALAGSAGGCPPALRGFPGRLLGRRGGACPRAGGGGAAARRRPAPAR